MNTFEFVRCSKNDVRVRAMFDKTVFDSSLEKVCTGNSWQFYFMLLCIVFWKCLWYFINTFPGYRKIAYIRVPQSKAIRSTFIRVEVVSRQPRWPCCSVSSEAKSNDCRSNSMGLLDGWVLRFIGHHILSDWRAFDLPESYAKKDSHFQCAAFDILLDAN